MAHVLGRGVSQLNGSIAIVVNRPVRLYDRIYSSYSSKELIISLIDYCNWDRGWWFV